jgi:hypothetical protein
VGSGQWGLNSLVLSGGSQARLSEPPIPAKTPLHTPSAAWQLKTENWQLKTENWQLKTENWQLKTEN